MNNIIFVPTIFKTNPTLSDRVLNLFYQICKRYKFEIHFTDHIDTDSASIALVYVGAHGHKLLTDSLKMRRATKIIYLLTGPHSFNRELIEPIMDRANLVLCTYADFFAKKFPQFKNRFTFLPLYFAPHSRYTKLKLRKKPIMKCLFTGHSNPQLYPIRHYVRASVMNEKEWQQYIVIMRHPRWQNNQDLKSYELPSHLNDTYAPCLNKYFCSLSTSIIYKYAIAKYFEIPAAGSLLLGERIPELDMLGFAPWQHYVPINIENVLGQIKTCIENPGDFESIRAEGMSYVRENHSINNRVRYFGDLLNVL